MSRSIVLWWNLCCFVQGIYFVSVFSRLLGSCFSAQVLGSLSMMSSFQRWANISNPFTETILAYKVQGQLQRRCELQVKSFQAAAFNTGSLPIQRQMSNSCVSSSSHISRRCISLLYCIYRLYSKVDILLSINKYALCIVITELCQRQLKQTVIFSFPWNLNILKSQEQVVFLMGLD